jgi:hypothetical protein
MAADRALVERILTAADRCELALNDRAFAKVLRRSIRDASHETPVP